MRRYLDAFRANTLIAQMIPHFEETRNPAITTERVPPSLRSDTCKVRSGTEIPHKLLIFLFDDPTAPISHNPSFPTDVVMSLTWHVLRREVFPLIQFVYGIMMVYFHAL